MAITGYSGTALINKLGIGPGMKVLLINEPEDYFKLLAVNIKPQLCKKNETPDFVHLFTKNYKEFDAAMKKLKNVCRENPRIIIWISWYKKAAQIATDMTEDVIRNYALSSGLCEKNDLVDVKVCAVSEIWSGLKLVVPIAKR